MILIGYDNNDSDVGDNVPNGFTNLIILMMMMRRRRMMMLMISMMLMMMLVMMKASVQGRTCN